jgi:hypothetical protein
MYKNEQRHHSARRSKPVASSMSGADYDRRILWLIAYMLASATILLWLVYLPTITDSILTTLNSLPQQLTTYGLSIASIKGIDLMLQNSSTAGMVS